MKDIKQFAKISAWLSLFIVVFGGLVFSSAWLGLPSEVIGVGMIAAFALIFGILLVGMLILDTMIDEKERKITYVRYSNRDARCKGYVEFTWKEKK
jgi:tetrahydromethanopterin S-methyltransferase subunit E